MESTRCKRCGVWVYDGSPLCLNCLKRHNEVYNHALYHDELIEPIVVKSTKLFKLFYVIIPLIMLFVTYVFMNHLMNNALDYQSFPPHAHVFEFDEYLFRTKTNSPITFETEGKYGYFVKIIEFETNNTVISFFMHPDRNYELSIPVGNYVFVYGLGKKWENIFTLFGQEGIYYQSKNSYSFTEMNGYTIRLTERGNLDFRNLELNETINQ